MLHSPDNCNEVDCQECQDLVDAGLIYGCDFCRKTLHSCEFNHIYDEKSGVHKCLNCVEEERKELISKCYNQLVAHYLSYTDEYKIVFLQILEILEGKVILSGEVGGDQCDVRNNLWDLLTFEFKREDLQESLKKLVEVFNLKSIKNNTIKITFNNGSFYTSNVVYPNSTPITSVS